MSNKSENKGWVIVKPSLGEYKTDCLRFEERSVDGLENGEVLVRTLLMSLDPTSRNWLKLDPVSTFVPISIGDPMIGVGVGIVEESRSNDFAPGDLGLGILFCYKNILVGKN